MRMEDSAARQASPGVRTFHKSVNINSHSDTLILIEEEFCDLLSPGHAHYNHMWYNRVDGEIRAAWSSYPDVNFPMHGQRSKERWDRVYILRSPVTDNLELWSEMCLRALHRKRVIPFSDIDGVNPDEHIKLWSFLGVKEIEALAPAVQVAQNGFRIDLYRDRWGGECELVGPGFRGTPTQGFLFICSLARDTVLPSGVVLGGAFFSEIVTWIAEKSREAAAALPGLKAPTVFLPCPRNS